MKRLYRVEWWQRTRKGGEPIQQSGTYELSDVQVREWLDPTECAVGGCGEKLLEKIMEDE